MQIKIALKLPVLYAMSLVLVACGGSSSTAPGTDPNTDNSADNTPIIPIVDDPPESIAVNLPTDDIRTGGFVGTTSGPRGTITMPDNANGHMLGLVKRNRNDGLRLFANFGRFRRPEGFFEYVTDFNRPLDSCQEVSGGISGGLYAPAYGSKFTPNFLAFEPFSAGEVLPLLGPSGTVGEMIDDDGDGWFYDAIYDRPLGQVEFELQISIPGAAFPGFQPLAIPKTEKLLGFRAAGGEFYQELREDFNPAETPLLVWKASDDPNAYLHMEFSAAVPGLQGQSDIEYWNIHCSIQDDGQFRFPQAIIDLFPRKPSNSELRWVARVSVKEISQPGVTLLLVNYHEAQ